MVALTGRSTSSVTLLTRPIRSTLPGLRPGILNRSNGPPRRTFALSRQLRRARKATLLSSLLAVGVGGAGLWTAKEAFWQDSPVHVQVLQADGGFKEDSDDPLDIFSPERLSNLSHHLERMPLSQLFRQYVVFLAISQPFLVDVAPKIVGLMEILRDKLPLGIGGGLWNVFLGTMRRTFFAQFVAGEDVNETLPLLDGLYSETGTGGMLNWSAEAEETHTPNAQSNGQVVWSNDRVMDLAMREMQRAVQAAAAFKTDLQIKPTMVAVKLTGLVTDPAIFERLSATLANGCATGPSEEMVKRESTGMVANTPQDMEVLRNLRSSLRSLCVEAQQSGVRIVFDAEQSWYQPSIDELVRTLQKEFNAQDKAFKGPLGDRGLPLVYTTYQANLKGCMHNLMADLKDAEEHGYGLGVKLVRGAYVVSENAHARRGDQESKVWSSKAETDECYNECGTMILDYIANDVEKGKLDVGPAVIFATHNAESVRMSLAFLRDAGLVSNAGDRLEIDARLSGKVSYAQLLSMADNLGSAINHLFPNPKNQTFIPINNLYIPYGDTGQVLPYLIRRAQENKSVLQGSNGSSKGGAVEQRQATGREVKRRIASVFGV